ncbi:MAG: mechanosensitive ion channel family protein [Planctomycetes bacterium]|nr:mechanosensitive ion channel family protein [Planctomycetota bacterium]
MENQIGREKRLRLLVLIPAAVMVVLAAGLAGESSALAESVAPAIPAAQSAETPEAAAARTEAEQKEKREHERREIMSKAEHFVETADATVSSTLPYPLNLLFGVRIYSISMWRFVACAALIGLSLLIMILASRRFTIIKRQIESDEAISRLRLALNVGILTLKNSLKLFILGFTLRGASSLIVTPYHPEIVWLCELLVYLGGAVYFFDLVGIVDQAYGDRFFHSSDRLMDTVRPMILKGIRGVILCFAGLHIYQGITGQPMFSLLAGLGIGGLALALASQATLQNLLGFASIAMDKAFLVGDAVTISNFDGTVESVGLRSTRLRSYDGNSVVIPNASAINSNIINRNRRPYIRREIRLSLSPFNTHAKIIQAMEAIREILDNHEGKVAGLPPVVRFADYEPARFVIQAMFWYNANNPFYLDECSRINLDICKRLSDLDVMFS